MRSGKVSTMKAITKLGVLALIGVLVSGFECKKNVSSDEIPYIKLSVHALEQVVAARNTIYLDSLLSRDAAEEGTTPVSVLDFVYGEDLTEFTGFTERKIFFRGDAARVDCMITGPEGPVRPITITMRKEGDIWLLKKIQPRLDDPLKLSPADSL